MELLFLILIKCLPSQLVVSVASHFHEWLNFGTLKPRPKADNVLCLEAFQRQPGEGTIWIFGWECPVRTLKTLSLFSCTKNPTSSQTNYSTKTGWWAPTKSLILPSSVLHHIRKYSRPKACDSKPRPQGFSQNLKAPFTAAHRSQKSRFAPASAETVARF